MGLNTSTIAHYRGNRKGRKNHAAFEKDAFFKLGRIDMLLVSPPVPPDTVNFASYVLKGLMDDPMFVKKWRYGLLRSSGAVSDTIEAFYSAGFVDSLEATARYQFRETMKWSNKWAAVDSTDGAGTHN
jgi:arabinofuranosyltransferase